MEGETEPMARSTKNKINKTNPDKRRAETKMYKGPTREK